MVDVLFRVKYYATKGLLSVFGPASLASGDDPMDRLERKRDARLGPRQVKEQTRPAHKRSFSEGVKKANSKPKS